MGDERSAGIALWISWLLRWGVLVSGGLIGIGWVFMLLGGGLATERSVDLATLLTGVAQGNFSNLAMIGIRLLIVLPVLRVGLSAIFFARSKDYRFVAMSIFVLLILLISVFSGSAER